MPLRCVVVAAFVLAAALAGVPPAVAAPAQETAGEEAGVARQMLIRRADLPRGWRVDDLEDATGDGDLCAVFRRSAMTATGLAAGPAFARLPALVAPVAFVFPRAAVARQRFARLTSRRYQRCFARQLVDAAREDDEIRVGRFGVRRVSGPVVGDQRDIARIRVPMTVDGVRVALFLDMAHVRLGRGIAFVLFAAGRTPFDEALRDKLLETVEARMERALAS